MHNAKFGSGVDYNHARNVLVNESIRAIFYEENNITHMGVYVNCLVQII
jgi:hypothetical protein